VKASFDIAKEALKLSPYVPDSVFEGDKFILLPEIGHPKSVEQKKLSGESTTSTNSGPPPVVVDAKYHDNSLFAIVHLSPSFDRPDHQCHEYCDSE
jgi:hypothetical protein